MNEQEIQAEKDRLRPLLFKGVAEQFKYAARDGDNKWFIYKSEPIRNKRAASEWLCSGVHATAYRAVMWSENQPETTLGWTQTLIERGGK